MTATLNKNDDPKVLDDRIEQFMEIGFSYEEAKALASAKRSDGNYWRVSSVQRMINHRDCTHALAVDLLT